MRAFLAGFARTGAILVAFALGALFPQAHVFAWFIQWIIVGMLFLVFLGTSWNQLGLRASHGTLLAANILIAFVSLGAGWLIGGREVALAGFFSGITPTAAAAPVVVSFMRRDVGYATAAFVLTNLVVAALLPLLLPLVLGEVDASLFRRVAGSVGILIFVPLGLALLVRRVHPAATRWPTRLRDLAFAGWVMTIFLVISNASHFLREQSDVPRVVILKIAVVSLAVCATSFGVGRLLGGSTHGPEASQCLGQKNNNFSVSLALSYASPLVALGPTCYILWHNLWNSWQLHRGQHKQPEPAQSDVPPVRETPPRS